MTLPPMPNVVAPDSQLRRLPLMVPANKSKQPRPTNDPAPKAEHRGTGLSITLPPFDGICEQVDTTSVHKQHCPQSAMLLHQTINCATHLDGISEQAETTLVHKRPCPHSGKSQHLNPP